MANLDSLKQKYEPVIALAKTLGVRLDHVHVEGERLVIAGAASTDTVKNQVWTKVKAVDATFADLKLDLSIDSSLPAPKAAQQMHTVAKGETLSAIAKKYYGNANKYMTIFNANKDQLSDPDRIMPGQSLKIPNED